jgi:hypothetical protein
VIRSGDQDPFDVFIFKHERVEARLLDVTSGDERDVLVPHEGPVYLIAAAPETFKNSRRFSIRIALPSINRKAQPREPCFFLASARAFSSPFTVMPLDPRSYSPPKCAWAAGERPRPPVRQLRVLLGGLPERRPGTRPRDARSGVARVESAECGWWRSQTPCIGGSTAGKITASSAGGFTAVLKLYRIETEGLQIWARL